MITTLFILSAGLLVYIYFVYPAVVILLAKIRGNAVETDDTYLPTISFITAAYNEEKIIEKKILNMLDLDYPREKMELVIVSDGCTDRTNQIVSNYQDKGIILHKRESRRGKTAALNETIPRTKNEILVLSDANTMYRRDSIRQLVKFLAHPKVGAVTGDVKILNDSPEFGEAEGFYYKYERSLQLGESIIGSIVGVDGAMYALRREVFIPPSDEMVLDDFIISMNVVKQGYRVIYNPEAIAYENATPSLKQEFMRKSRIVAGGIQAFAHGEGLPRLSQLKEWIMYLSHKFLRWLTPVLLIVVFFSNLFLVKQTWAQVTLGLQLLFYAAALAGYLFRKKNSWRVLRIPFYFCMINAAALVGLIKGVFGMQKVTWKKADREIVNIS